MSWQNAVVRHTEPMDAQNNLNGKNAIGGALLCAIGHNEPNTIGGTSSPALIPIAGMPLIEFQINQLLNNGITRIFLEIETLPGALVSLADRTQAKGATIEFVRSPAELGGKIEPDLFLFVLSEGSYVDDLLLSEIVKQNSAFIVTVDGREENAVFERIDLNSYWTGIAMLGANSVEAIASLPEEWSISSSLLRRALQDSIVHRPMKQDIIAAKQLCKINTASDADYLSKQILQKQSAQVDGLIEKFVFAPCAAWIAAKFWKLPSGTNIILAVLWLSLAGCIAIAIAGFSPSAALLAMISMFAFQVSRLLQGANHLIRFNLSNNTAVWLAFAIAFLSIFWNYSAAHSENLFIGLIVIGLIFHAKQALTSNWGRYLLCSPALLALLIAVLDIMGLLLPGFMLIALCQLGLLIFFASTERSFRRG